MYITIIKSVNNKKKRLVSKKILYAVLPYKLYFVRLTAIKNHILKIKNYLYE